MRNHTHNKMCISFFCRFIKLLQSNKIWEVGKKIRPNRTRWCNSGFTGLAGYSPYKYYGVSLCMTDLTASLSHGVFHCCAVKAVLFLFSFCFTLLESIKAEKSWQIGLTWALLVSIASPFWIQKWRCKEDQSYKMYLFLLHPLKCKLK